MKKWSKEELEKAIELCKKGLGYSEIGASLNRTNRAIKNKLEEVGIKYYDFKKTKEEILCKCCKKKFEAKIFENKKFCSQSCAATFNNKIYKKRNKKLKKCLACCKILDSWRNKAKFCNSKCQHKFNKNKSFELIKNGDNSLSSDWYKRYLIEKNGEKCMECGWCEINKTSNKIPIELEHIDGDSTNNNLKNLKLLCPNCHSLTSTYKALNKGNGRHERMKRYNEGKSY